MGESQIIIDDVETNIAKLKSALRFVMPQHLSEEFDSAKEIKSKRSRLDTVYATAQKWSEKQLDQVEKAQNQLRQLQNVLDAQQTDKNITSYLSGQEVPFDLTQFNEKYKKIEQMKKIIESIP